MTLKHTTKNDLPQACREKVAAILNLNLANAIHLSLQAKQAHWNVKGPHFLPLHELFDKIYEHASEWSDNLAERAVQLGALAESGIADLAARSKLKADLAEQVSGKEFVQALLSSVSVFARMVREAIDSTDAAGDADTADLCTEISREADKLLWFLEAHLQAKE